MNRKDKINKKENLRYLGNPNTSRILHCLYCLPSQSIQLPKHNKDWAMLSREVCVQLLLQSQALCHSAHRSTWPSLSNELVFSSGGRTLTPPKFSLKPLMPETRLSPRLVLQEKLESLVGVLHGNTWGMGSCKMTVALQLQTGSFRDSDVVIRLGHWLGPALCWNINAESVNSAKTKVSSSTREHWSHVDKE